jgi:hypothetical protein
MKEAPMAYDRYIAHLKECKGQLKPDVNPGKAIDGKKIFEEEKR